MVNHPNRQPRYRILDENGDEFISAAAIRAASIAAGVTGRRQADKDCADLNSTGDGVFRVERVTGPK